MPITLNGTSNAITFPDNSIQNTSAIVSGYVPYAILPAGSVLQVVQGIYSTPFSTTSTSYVSTGFTTAITPKFATSRILVQVSVVCGNSVNQWHYCTIYRNNTTNLSAGSGNPSGYLTQNSSDYLTTLNFQLIDTPATTSSTSYTLYTRCTGSSNVRCFVDAQPAYFTIMEIAA